MNAVRIGSTTHAVSEVLSFEFQAAGSGSGNSTARFPSLRADFADGSFATSSGNEAVTLKVLLASLGIPEVPMKVIQ